MEILCFKRRCPQLLFRKKLAKVAVRNHAYSFRLRAAYWPSKCNRESKRLKKLPTKSIWKESGSIQTFLHNPWFWSYICVNSNRLNFSFGSTNIHPPKFQQPRPPGRWCFNFFPGESESRVGTTSLGGHLGTSNGLGGQRLAERNALSIAAGSSVLLGTVSIKQRVSFEFVGSHLGCAWLVAKSDFADMLKKGVLHLRIENMWKKTTTNNKGSPRITRNNPFTHQRGRNTAAVAALCEVGARVTPEVTLG